MKTKLLLAILLLAAIAVFAQDTVSIRDIQFIGADSLNTYFVDDVPGPYTGDTVTVTGIVMVPPYKGSNPDSGTVIYIGTLAGFYMQDTADTEWSGILVYISNPDNYPDFQILDTATVVTVTGTVVHYENSTQKTTEIELIDFTAADNIVRFNNRRPEPVLLTLDSLKEIGTSNSRADAEKWEGTYVEFRNVRTLDRNWTSGGFRIIDDNNTIVSIYTRSNYIYGSDPPTDNTVLEYIRGFIETRGESAGGAALCPIYLSDYKVTQFPPSFSSITRDPVVVAYNDPVDITAEIEDQDGTVDSVSLFYRVNGGSLMELQTTAGPDTNTWVATIPGQSDSSLVDYFFRAVDNANNVSLYPSDTTRGRYFYFVLNRDLTIQDIQYSPFGSGYSGYNGYPVTVSGVVTADTSDIGDGSTYPFEVYIQNGTGPWSGIRINGTEVLGLKRGDDVTVSGTVGEQFSVSWISGIDSTTNININSTGNALPEPELLPTSTFENITDGTPSTEQWEGVLVKFDNLTVTDENADGNAGPVSNNYGEILVDDGSGPMRVELQDGNHSYHNYWDSSLVDQPIRIIEGDHLDGLIGIQWFSFGNYKLIPRKDDDFVNLTGVEEEYVTPAKYSLNQNYPNPFNPSTVISYTLPKEGMVTLKVYNILGQQVKILVDEYKSSGTYKVNFDAGNLPSGVYFYAIRSSGFSSVKKMMLIK